MIAEAITLYALVFASVYLLQFWFRVGHPLDSKIRKFNIMIPNMIGGCVFIAVWLINVPIILKVVVTLWKIVLVWISRYNWKKDFPDPRSLSIPFIFAIFIFFPYYAYIAAAQ